MAARTNDLPIISLLVEKIQFGVGCSENKLTAKAAKSAEKNKTSLLALCVLRGEIFMVIGVVRQGVRCKNRTRIAALALFYK